MKGAVRVEKHMIRSSDPMFKGLIDDCKSAVHLYNRALFILRHAFCNQHNEIPEYKDLIKKDHFISWYDLNKRMVKLNEPTFRALKSKVSQRIIKDAWMAFQTFFKALKEYKRNPKKFLAKPKMPSYKEKDTFHALTYTYQSARLQKDGTINISRDRKLPIHTNLTKFKELKIVPRNGYITFLISYEKPLEIKDNLQFDKCVGIDLGVGNLMTITSNDGSISSIVNGSPLISILHRYNKALAKLQEHRISKEETSRYKHRRDAVIRKRNCRVDDYLHKASRFVVDEMLNNNVGRCFIGLNPDWKQRCKMKHGSPTM